VIYQEKKMPQENISKQLYLESISPWLPSTIIDCHVHIGRSEHMETISPERFKEMWAIEIASSYTWEEMRDGFEMLFPDKTTEVLAFGWPYREMDSDLNNNYVLQGKDDPVNKAKILAVTRPQWDARKVAELMDQGFIGIKPYPDLSPQCSNEVSTFDFLPHSHLEVLNDRHGILMLHLPRKGRVADQNNIDEILEINDRYPNIKFIVAHIGRAFCLPTAEKGLPKLAERPGIYFDTAANLNPDVFAYALELVGADRVLYGSDLPISFMRGMREHVGEQYINYTDGDYSWNTNRKRPEEEAEYTYFGYEEILAIKKGLDQAGMGQAEIEKVFYSNSASLLSGK